MTQGGPLPPGVPGVGWVDVAARVVVQVGFPIVVAAVLLWFLLTKFQENMMALAARMAATAEVAEALVAQEQASYGALTKLTDAVLALTREQQATTQQLVTETQLMARIASDSDKLVTMRAEELQLKRKP